MAATATIGIDVGIARFATLSDRTFYEPLNSLQRREERLRCADRAIMSRKKKFSSNWREWKARVQQI
ncbi:transposase [Paraburkholderia mimosarum]|uniref:transposase n=1 Tax=Paraburkholderia mimosarum TaxID=312026 RepID=UPI0004010188|nr:transposase [Paraburkholderia mimosarum]